MSLAVSAALVAVQVDCARIPSCHHESTFKCPLGPNWKRTAHGCWDGHRFYVYKYTIRRTSLDVTGYRHIKNSAR